VNVFQSIRIALRSIIQNKMRSALTMLGIVIGVAAVIALVAAGAGAQADVLERFESMGANVLTISPGSAFTFARGPQRVSMGSTTTASFTSDDVKTLRELANSLIAVAPQYSGNATVTYGSNSTNTSVIGTTIDYMLVNSLELGKGRFVTTMDEANRARVVVLSASLAEDLFAGYLIEPLGQTIKINRENYQVVGILAEEDETAGFGFSQDNVFMPLSTAQLKLGGVGKNTVSSISVMVESSERVDFAKAELNTILRTIRGLSANDENDFSITDPSDIVSNIEATSQTFTTLLASIAAISLVVGGIGIMNIMLVSVTERTREIGIRKAVGAKRRDILAQFLVESVVLSVLSGLIGIGVGIGAAQIISPLLGTEQAVITSDSVILAMAVSTGVGIFFGIYPANRASRLHPIDALRYE
jgi:putative ABC transport system permease protein